MFAAVLVAAVLAAVPALPVEPRLSIPRGSEVPLDVSVNPTSKTPPKKK